LKQAKNQLILVEGLTGLGKSTLAHFITRQFQYNGVAASWIHEAEDPHPVSVDVESDITSFMIKALERWDTLVIQTLESSMITVIEACFFNNLIEMLFAHCLDRATILDFGMKLQQVIKPAKPALVYLTHPNLSMALEENFRSRGAEFRDFVIKYIADTPIAKKMGWNDYAGMLIFWREFVTITDLLFREYEIDKLAIDVSSGEWERYNYQVTEFLALTLKDDPKISFDAAEKYVGKYQFSESGKIYTIQYKNRALVTDIFKTVNTKLIPENEVTFLAEKWHFELHFEFNHDTGEATSFTIGGRDVDYLKAVGLKAKKVMEI